jgi:osmotically-inducible protein OsmY
MLVAIVATCACVHAQNFRNSGALPQAPLETDLELAARVKAALRAAPHVNDTHIDVSIDHGKVVLSGLVEDNRALLDALQVAKKAAEGRNVIDAMSIIKTSAH